jgi:hypothetical protein
MMRGTMMLMEPRSASASAVADHDAAADDDDDEEDVVVVPESPTPMMTESLLVPDVKLRLDSIERKCFWKAYKPLSFWMPSAYAICQRLTSSSTIGYLFLMCLAPLLFAVSFLAGVYYMCYIMYPRMAVESAFDIGPKTIYLAIEKYKTDGISLMATVVGCSRTGKKASKVTFQYRAPQNGLVYEGTVVDTEYADEPAIPILLLPEHPGSAQTPKEVDRLLPLFKGPSGVGERVLYVVLCGFGFFVNSIFTPFYSFRNVIGPVTFPCWLCWQAFNMMWACLAHTLSDSLQSHQLENWLYVLCRRIEDPDDEVVMRSDTSLDPDDEVVMRSDTSLDENVQSCSGSVIEPDIEVLWL